MKGFFVVVSIILAVLQLSVIPRMPGVGMFLNIILPFLLVLTWYAPLWGTIASLAVGFFELPYTSLPSIVIVLSFLLPCIVVALISHFTYLVHPSRKPFPYGILSLLAGFCLLLYFVIRVLGGVAISASIFLSEAFSMFVLVQMFTWIMVQWYAKNIPKPFFYKRA